MSYKLSGIIGAIWGFSGTFALIVFAVWRLMPVATESLGYSLTPIQWLALIGNVLYMAYAEGYRGFQLAFAPRVAARTLYLAKNPTPLRIILAPLFTAGYFHATRHRMIASYALTTTIICLIILVRFLDQPWRGIIDAGVVTGLIWGLISMVYFIMLAITSGQCACSPEIS